MGLWDEEEIDVEPQIEETNKYLEDPNKGIELISKLLSYDKKYNSKRIPLRN